MALITCDLCGESKDCLQKKIEAKEYDICSDCWKPLEQKLRDKGRVKKEMVFLPPPKKKEREQEKPEPGEPPKIWGATDRPN
jgi:ribosome-binding protein aMBF1 (putative translation factor)